MILKKYKFLFFVIFILFAVAISFNVVMADENIISLEDIRVSNQSENVDATVVKNDGQYHFNVTFHRLNDYVLYKINLKNNSDIDYSFQSIKFINDNDNLEYQLSDYKNEKISAKSQKDILVKVIYKKLLDGENRELEDNVSFKIALIDDNGNNKNVIINPTTWNLYYVFIFLIILFIPIFFFVVKYFVIKKKNFISIAFVMILIIPILVFADSFHLSLAIKCSYKFYDKVILNIIDGVDNQSDYVIYGTSIEDLTVPNKEGYVFDGWFNDETFQNRLSAHDKIIDDTSIYPKWVPMTITCSPGKYLNIKSLECSENCLAGNYCPGGDYHYSENDNQGIYKCVSGSYSDDNASSCIACSPGKTTDGEGKNRCNNNCSNSIGVDSWENATWNSNNTVSNLCIINTCQSVGYTYSNNACFINGTYYTKVSNSLVLNQNVYGKITVDSNTFSKNSFSTTSEKYSYAYFKYDIENNIIKSRSLCFGITSRMNLSGLNIGEYCLKSLSGDNTYRENVAILKSVFRNYSSYCTESTGKFECKNFTYIISNGNFHYYVVNDGTIFAEYDEPINGLGKPYYTMNVNSATYRNGGCLDGETEVEVYDKKKKKRRRKKLKDVTPDDLILCWDFDKGEFVFMEPLWIKRVESMDLYYLLEFSDGSSLKVIGDHKIFDFDKGKFINAGADSEVVIGTRTYNSKGEVVEVLSWRKVEEPIDSYNVITNYHMNLFANGILTSCVFSNIYSIEDMRYIRDNVECINDSDLDGIDEKYIHGLRLNEVPVCFRGDKKKTLSYIKKYIESLIFKEK